MSSRVTLVNSDPVLTIVGDRVARYIARHPEATAEEVRTALRDAARRSGLVVIKEGTIRGTGAERTIDGWGFQYEESMS